MILEVKKFYFSQYRNILALLFLWKFLFLHSPNRFKPRGIKFSTMLSSKCGVQAMFNAVVRDCLDKRVKISRAAVTPIGGGCISFKIYLKKS